MEFPTLVSDQLRLRQFTPGDVLHVVEYAGSRKVASDALHIPYPFQESLASEWISEMPRKFHNGSEIVFAMDIKITNAFVGAVGLTFHNSDKNAEIGYWIGEPFWGNGFATEAVKKVIQYGFEHRNLHRIYATALAKNPASIKVLEKSGMKYEGTLKQHVFHWGRFEDIVYYGIINE